jgi:hypothetical protein
MNSTDTSSLRVINLRLNCADLTPLAEKIRKACSPPKWRIRWDALKDALIVSTESRIWSCGIEASISAMPVR